MVWEDQQKGKNSYHVFQLDNRYKCTALCLKIHFDPSKEKMLACTYTELCPKIHYDLSKQNKFALVQGLKKIFELQPKLLNFFRSLKVFMHYSSLLKDQNKPINRCGAWFLISQSSAIGVSRQSPLWLTIMPLRFNHQYISKIKYKIPNNLWGWERGFSRKWKLFSLYFSSSLST